MHTKSQCVNKIRSQQINALHTTAICSKFKYWDLLYQCQEQFGEINIAKNAKIRKNRDKTLCDNLQLFELLDSGTILQLVLFFFANSYCANFFSPFHVSLCFSYSEKVKCARDINSLLDAKISEKMTGSITKKNIFLEAAIKKLDKFADIQEPRSHSLLARTYQVPK